MSDHEASRTLVKSLPELWAECSDAASLARHLGEFGEIKITRLEPETTVAWEGERASGTVRIEPSAWGTRVTLTAQTEGEVPTAVVEAPAVDTAAPVETAADEEATRSASDVDSGSTVLSSSPALPPTRRGLLARLRTRLRPAMAPVAMPPPPEPEPEPEPALVAAEEEAPPPEAPLPPEPPLPPEAEAPAGGSLDADSVLTAALDSLGQAHHRPYSRA